MTLKQLGKQFGRAGSWDEGLRIERRFLIDSIGVDSTQFALERWLRALGVQPREPARVHAGAAVHPHASALRHVRRGAPAVGPARVAEEPVRRHAHRGTGARQDRQHLPHQHAVRLRRARERQGHDLLGAGQSSHPAQLRPFSPSSTASWSRWRRDADVTAQPGPLRVAIVGSGPSGFYAAEHLQKKVPGVEIDMFDRLPTPYGLVRGGVAPDHPKIKSVTRDVRAHCRASRLPLSRQRDDRRRHRACRAASRSTTPSSTPSGAQTDRHLGIPGEELAGSHAATEFVGWYNGHPDYRDRRFELCRHQRRRRRHGQRRHGRHPHPGEQHGRAHPHRHLASRARGAPRAARWRRSTCSAAAGPPRPRSPTLSSRNWENSPRPTSSWTPARLELDEHSAHQLTGHEDRTAEKNLHTLREFAERTPSGPEAPHRASLPRVARRDTRQQSRGGREARRGTAWCGARHGELQAPRPPGRPRRYLPASSFVRWATRGWRFRACPSTSAPASFPTSRAACSWHPAPCEMLAGVYAVGLDQARPERRHRHQQARLRRDG